MTKDDFLHLQELQRNSGLPLMKYLRENSLSYSTYNYWKRKFLDQDSEVPFAQVCLRPSTEVVLPSLAGHITLCFPNGVHVCLDAGMEESASRLITSYPYGHVLPE